MRQPLAGFLKSFRPCQRDIYVISLTSEVDAQHIGDVVIIYYD
jgi:hypothetical protein